MKKTILILFVILANNCISQSINNLDEKNGYKDLKFGTLKSSMKDKIYDCTPAGHCLIIGDSYRKIRNINVDQVYTMFTDNKLFAIILSIKGKENVDNLLNIYSETYGKATSSDSKETVVTWEGKTVVLSFDIDVDDGGNVTATIIISTKDLLQKNSEKEIQKNIDEL